MSFNKSKARFRRLQNSPSTQTLVIADLEFIPHLMRGFANMEFMVNGKLAATAAQGGVFINIGTMKPANPPDGLQKKFDEELQRT
ncbi:MAG: hypothetical protein ACLQBQ_08080 [Smithella sp.]